MKKLLLWLLMVVVMVALLLGGAAAALYAMTGKTSCRKIIPLSGKPRWNPTDMTGRCRCWDMWWNAIFPA